MVHIIIGAVIGISFFLLTDWVFKKELHITWWQWLIAVMGFVFVGFVLEMIVSFLQEGSPKAAMVMGSIMGFIAVLWGVLLSRFVFNKKDT